jgi:hypothetical protein
MILLLLLPLLATQPAAKVAAESGHRALSPRNGRVLQDLVSDGMSLSS